MGSAASNDRHPRGKGWARGEDLNALHVRSAAYSPDGSIRIQHTARGTSFQRRQPPFFHLSRDPDTGVISATPNVMFQPWDEASASGGTPFRWELAAEVGLVVNVGIYYANGNVWQPLNDSGSVTGYPFVWDVISQSGGSGGTVTAYDRATELRELTDDSDADAATVDAPGLAVKLAKITMIYTSGGPYIYQYPRQNTLGPAGYDTNGTVQDWLLTMPPVATQPRLVWDVEDQELHYHDGSDYVGTLALSAGTHNVVLGWSYGDTSPGAMLTSETGYDFYTDLATVTVLASGQAFFAYPYTSWHGVQRGISKTVAGVGTFRNGVLVS